SESKNKNRSNPFHPPHPRSNYTNYDVYHYSLNEDSKLTHCRIDTLPHYLIPTYTKLTIYSKKILTFQKFFPIFVPLFNRQT
ncbi:hypothetical protein, partial [Flavobacterium filum]|uniref:hypothetical protein n=1 Tax=Flavobacterium filum TaxID=370974 RepID=UPI001B7FC1E2